MLETAKEGVATVFGCPLDLQSVSRDTGAMCKTERGTSDLEREIRLKEDVLHLHAWPFMAVGVWLRRLL